MKPFSASRRGTVALFVVPSLVVLALLAGDADAAQPPVDLGTADDFAVLAGQTVTNLGPSAITGDIGVAPGSAVAFLLACTGTIHAVDAFAAHAQRVATAS